MTDGGSPMRASSVSTSADQLTLSSPATDAACPAAPSASGSAVTDGCAAAQRQYQLRQRQHQQQQAQAQQTKARRRWSPELRHQFVAALQRLGGAQVATPKKIRALMKVDGLTIGEVKSHLQKYRLHTRRAAAASDGVDLPEAAAASDGGDLPEAAAAAPAPEQQHSTPQSGSPQGPLQLTVSSRAMSATAGECCDGDEAAGGGSESCR